MGIKDWFKKDKDPGPDPISGMTIEAMKPGWLVDYDMKTWEVAAAHFYEWGDDDISREWQLRSGDELVYLEREDDDEVEWSLNRKIAFGRLGSGIKEHVLEHGDPPDEIVVDGTTYYLEEMAGGHYFKDGEGPGQALLRWGYEDDDGKRYLGIEQWGEEDFDATLGVPVEEYQFTNILPKG
ncbi:MAG: DUF4178 domain-containing protein [Proteobacteria bacterium]|nr:DUF4178 domain-containing protein [Pseudomonadota bacterium]